ncbi:hypothetical protein NP493_131g02014 [Ridgeia piscesae]|uniref:Aminotransferase class I/classII large domain-containing protein n=1 Tax=Ridgeia piscesae TaxID=27915 RepID=A0AAD9P5F5_RIDPI|nr:hypothetical protein NP493_131g02014 [Ridgeia piscesae]
MASLMFSSHATVFVEDPTYFLAIGILRDDIGLNIVPERSRQLIELARKFNVLLFADDVYNLLHYDDTCSHAPPRLLAYDNKDDAEYKGHVISNGSFSKIFAPGIRLGWIESGDRIIKLLKKSATVVSAGCFNQFTAEVIATSLRLGLQQRHLHNLNSVYSTRVKSVAQKLRKNLPECVTFEVPRGGYFFWLQMPDGALAEKVAKDVYDLHKIRILPGNRCSPTGQCRNCIRISFAHYEEPVLLDAAQKLSDVITKHVAGIVANVEKTD